MAQLLIELFSEEIPARMQLGAARDFERLIGAKFAASGLSFDTLKAYVSPRRLALVVEGLPVEQAAVTEEVKGPREGAPEQAMAGFLRKVGLSQDQLVVENGVWMAKIHKPGRRTLDVLPDMLRDVILNFPWPKSMRSGTSSFRWVRPLKRILFLFDGQVVPFELEGLTAANLTQGHRFLGSGQAFQVSDFASYEKGLRENFVILDHAERQNIILDKAHAVCAAAGCELIEDQGLLEEVAGLNEWPVPMLGDMDPQFLTLPPEVIKTSMRTHQKYFAVRQKDGKMAAHFLPVANIVPSDDGSEIRRGNAKVLSARLSDGVFFWNEDNREGNFEQWLSKLKGVTFHAKLGTMAQRVERLTRIARDLAPRFGVDADKAAKAARLAKADLASYMVGEFPELQGVMGGYYADAAKMEPAIADAVRQHYKPQGPSDNVPEAPLSAVVALADKLDTLIGFFAIDEKPTGSKDPFALRRSALGILRILREHGLRADLSELVASWYRTLLIYAGSDRCVYVDTEHWRGSAGPRWADGDGEIYENYLRDFSEGLLQSPVWIRPTDRDYDLDILYEHVPNVPEVEDAVLSFRAYAEVRAEIEAFMNERLKVQLKDEGRRYDAIEAVFARKDGDVLRLVAKLDALEGVLAGAEGENLLAVHKRAANILSAAKWTKPAGVPLPSSQAEASETELSTALTRAQGVVEKALEAENFTKALKAIAALRQNVDSFLDGVLVNAEDEAVRAARLNLLAGVCVLSEGMADLSRIA